MSVAEAEAFAADELSAGCEQQAVAIEKGCAMSHEGCGKRGVIDALMGVELVDPCLGEIGVAGFFLCTHGHEELAELLITAGTHQKMLSEAIV